MIERPYEVVLGRSEPTTDDNRAIRLWLASRLSRVKWLWKYRYGDARASEIDAWNVVRLHGSFLRWTKVGLEVWEGLGRDPLPVMPRSHLYVPGLDKVDLIEFKPSLMWVLHDAHQLLPDVLPPAPTPKKKKKAEDRPVVATREQYEALSEELRRIGALSDPRSKTRRGLDLVLASMGKQVVGWDVVDLPRGSLAAHHVAL